MDKRVLLLGGATLLGFGLGSVVLYYYSHQKILAYEVFFNQALGFQILVGALYGGTTSFLAIAMLSLPYFAKVRAYYSTFFSKLVGTIIGVIFISLCAGFAEELFFRGALQPFIGLWPTSIIFVAIHGYLNPKKGNLFLYGIYMVFVTVGLGTLAYKIGLISSMVAHSVIDIILLYWMVFYLEKKEGV